MRKVEWPSYRFRTVLTQREAQVLDLVVIGKTNAEAGEVLGIAPATVEVHRQRVMHKLGVGSVAALVWVAMLGVRPPESYDPFETIDVPCGLEPLDNGRHRASRNPAAVGHGQHASKGEA